MRQQIWRRPALPLLLGVLALLCLLGLAGCGRAPRPVEPAPAGIKTSPAKGKAGLAEPLPSPEIQPSRDPRFSRKPRPPRNRIPHQARWPQKAAAIGFAQGEPYLDRALELLAGRYDSFAQELGLFDINEDGTPELMVIVYGTWMRGFFLYDLSGPVPVYLGWHWGPDGPAYARQAESGRAWRLDGNYSHGCQRLEVSELFVPAGGSLQNGLDIWECAVDSSTYDRSNLPTAPPYWEYRVGHSLFRDGRAVFSGRREESLAFPPDILLEERAAQDGEGKPAAQQLEENEYPITEMEERLEASLYHELLSSGWVGVPPPWATENDVYESNNWNSWLGLELPTRLRRLYEFWERQRSAA